MQKYFQSSLIEYIKNSSRCTRVRIQQYRYGHTSIWWRWISLVYTGHTWIHSINTGLLKKKFRVDSDVRMRLPDVKKKWWTEKHKTLKDNYTVRAFLKFWFIWQPIKYIICNYKLCIHQDNHQCDLEHQLFADGCSTVIAEPCTDSVDTCKRWAKFVLIVLLMRIHADQVFLLISRSSNEAVCSGHGECVCGQCVCNVIRGNQKYSGQYCECNDFSCNYHNGALCGGNNELTISTIKYLWFLTIIAQFSQVIVLNLPDTIRISC